MKTHSLLRGSCSCPLPLASPLFKVASVVVGLPFSFFFSFSSCHAPISDAHPLARPEPRRSTTRPTMATPIPDLSRGPVLLSFSIGTASFAFSTTIVRFCVRTRISNNTGPDDYAIAVATVCSFFALNCLLYFPVGIIIRPRSTRISKGGGKSVREGERTEKKGKHEEK